MSAPTLTGFLLARIAEDELVLDVADSVNHYRFGSARLLAECEAKRRIVERLTDIAWCSYSVRDVILGEMALPYANHPDYQQEWKP